MNLKVSRSQTNQKYTLSLKAEIPAEELQLLRRHKQEKQYLGLPEEIQKMCIEKKICGPRLTSPSFFESLHYLTGGLTLITPEVLTRGVELTCDYLPEGFSSLPEDIKRRYDELVASLRAREGWSGTETVS